MAKRFKADGKTRRLLKSGRADRGCCLACFEETELTTIREKAANVGLTVSVRRVRGRANHDDFTHVQFRVGQWVLTEWWPATGTAIVAGVKRTASTLGEVLALAIEAAGVGADVVGRGARGR